MGLLDRKFASFPNVVYVNGKKFGHEFGSCISYVKPADFLRVFTNETQLLSSSENVRRLIRVKRNGYSALSNCFSLHSFSKESKRMRKIILNFEICT